MYGHITYINALTFFFGAGGVSAEKIFVESVDIYMIDFQYISNVYLRDKISMQYYDMKISSQKNHMMICVKTSFLYRSVKTCFQLETNPFF